MGETMTYYAHVDKAEEDHTGKLYLEFHCLEMDFWDSILLLERKLFNQAISENKDQVIVVQSMKQDVINHILYKDFAELESQWMILYTNTDKIGVEATLFIDDAIEPRLIYVDKGELLDQESETGRSLFDKVSLNGFEDTENKETLLKAIAGGSDGRKVQAEFIASYNVGQGNCNAICDSQSVPLFYFDFGGGCYANRHTYVTPLKFCFRHRPAILLSHWDTDHYQSAKINPAYKNNQWIVPRQVIGPVHLKFFLSLPAGKVIWPAFLDELEFPWGSIVICKGPRGKKNHTGLAIIAELNSRVNTIKNVLLPGDAAYVYIYQALNESFDGLIATHHGANFDMNNAPAPQSRGTKALVYSYGLLNCYHHPKQNAMNAHKGYGWTLQEKNTPNGHIALIDNLNIPFLPCEGKECDLQLSQKF
jgi:hypothetical protein